MELDVSTIVLITSIIFATQTIAVFVQFKVNKTYNGLGWWLSGAVFQALGFFLMLLLNNKTIWIFSILGNPLVFLGQIFLNIGIGKFLGKKVIKLLYISLFTIFIVIYFYFIFIYNSIFGRSVVVGISAAVISFIAAHKLFYFKKQHFSGSANFIASVFFLYGLLEIALTIVTFYLPPMNSYQEFNIMPIRTLAFIFPIIGSLLWTFGFIIMVNQRLNAENLEEKEKLQMVFDISPDAKLITRASDGLLVDVNNGFLTITGFSRDEIIGNSIINTDLWVNLDDRQSYITELNIKGIVENCEYFFRRKDGNRFFGTISSKKIEIQGQVHIISVIYDITKRKQAEQEINDLLAEKELILKEVHHRIKNNMSTIHGLLVLQAGSLKDDLAIAALKDTGNRIQSMMLVYDLLYKSANFMELSVRDYLPRLIDEIISNFPNSKSVRIEKHIDDFVLGVKKLQPLAIIINELITNIMKYAFTGKDGDTIVLSATLIDNRVVIIVQDNGKGIPESVNFENTKGFGLMLVNALTAQIDGTIRLERVNGTRVILEFEK